MRCGALCRCRWLAKRKAERCKQMYCAGRCEPFQELLRKERAYVNYLETVVDKYLLPLQVPKSLSLSLSRRRRRRHRRRRRRTHSVHALACVILQTSQDRVLKEEVRSYRVIFSNIEDILSLHRLMLRRLYEVAEDWPDISQFASMLLSTSC
jgi:hypothetical protein